jgi:hypothetical protein
MGGSVVSLKDWYLRLKLKRACDQFDELLPKALEGDKKALAQLSWVLSAELTPDFLKTADRNALRDRYVFAVSGKFPFDLDRDDDGKDDDKS